MYKPIVPCFLLVLTSALVYGQAAGTQSVRGPLSFTKKMIAAESFESVAVFDVNNDGTPDLVSGSFWYEGPNYFKRNFIGAVPRVGEYYDDFSTIPIDVNGDGKMDFVTGGWFGKNLFWKENPGNNKEWPVHLIASPGNIETTRGWDIDGDGTIEICPNTPNDPLIIYRLKKDGTGKGTGAFDTIRLSARKSGHGLGFGDVNGDGRGDFILSDGWLEAPAQPFKQPWTFHADFTMGDCSIPIIVADVNGDGLNDLVVGQGHGYGLDWYQQKRAGQSISWVKHSIDPNNSQFHTMAWTDLDGDGKPELITGKRYRGHNENDAGAADPLGIYYYKWNGEAFSKQVVSYGPLGKGKGTGNYFAVHDLRGVGRKDIIVAGKDGLCIFYNNSSY